MRMNPFDRIKAYIKGKYNYELGFTGGLMLLEIERLMDEAKQNLDVAAAKINQSHQPLQTNDPRAAFWFGIGRSGVWVLPVVLAISVISWFYAQQSDFRDIIPVPSRICLVDPAGAGHHARSDENAGAKYARPAAAPALGGLLHHGDRLAV